MNKISDDEWVRVYRIVNRKHASVAHTEWFKDLVQDCALYALEKADSDVPQQALFVNKVGYRMKERTSRPDMGRDIMNKKSAVLSYDEAMDRLNTEEGNNLSRQIDEAASYNQVMEHRDTIRLFTTLLASRDVLNEYQQPVFDAMIEDKGLKQGAIERGVTPQVFTHHKNKMLTTLRNYFYEQGLYSISA